MIVLDVLDQRGASVARSRLSTLPATIGRGYDCDVVLDDPYVCARHLRIDEGPNGELYAEDLGSVNGISLVGMDVRVPRVPLTGDVKLRAGRTVLRVRDGALAVPPALPESVDAHGFSTRLEPSQLSALACLLALVLFAFQAYAESYERPSLARSTGTALGVLLALAVWAGVWAVVGRAMTHRFHFLRHLALAALASVAALLVNQLAEWLGFLAPASGAGAVVGVTGMIAIAVVLVGAQLGVSSSIPGPQRYGWSAGVAVGLCALLAVMSYADSDKFSTALDDPGSLKPYGVSWVRGEPASEFATHARTLQQKVDSLARDRD
jgi:hypothetical protein